ncbi:MAG: hypothetical protein WC223_13240 [Bacteroidales bacterium]|jgi:hypothetical protein
MDNYLKILYFLKQYYGDGNYYDIEKVLNIPKEQLNIIVSELCKEGFIEIKNETGITKKRPILTSEFKVSFEESIQGKGGRLKLEHVDYYVPFQAILKIKGNDYLKQLKEVKAVSNNHTKIEQQIPNAYSYIHYNSKLSLTS